MRMLKKIETLLRQIMRCHEQCWTLRKYIDPTSIRRVTLISSPTPTPLSTRDTQGVQIARGNDAQAVLTEAKDTHSVMAEAQQPSCTDATSGARAHEPTKRKRRKRNRKNSHVPINQVMVITMRASKNAKNVFQKKLNALRCKRTRQT